MQSPLKVAALSTLILAAASVPTIAAAEPAPTAAAGAPEGALDAPKFFGFQVVEARRGVDGKGWPTSTTLLAISYEEIYEHLRTLFGKNKAFAPGWTVVGVGRSDQHRFISVTIQDPAGQRFTCEIRSREDKVVQVELKAKPYKGSGGRMTAPPAPDRTPPATGGGAVKK